MYSILPLTYRMQFTGFGSAIRVLLHGNVRFEPEDIENLTIAFELALNKFELADRQDPLTVVLAKLIIELARDGERAIPLSSASRTPLIERGSNESSNFPQRAVLRLSPTRERLAQQYARSRHRTPLRDGAPCDCADVAAGDLHTFVRTQQRHRACAQ